MIFKLLFKNQPAFAKNPSESKFQAKQASLSTFAKHDFGTTRGLALLKLQSSNVIKRIICYGHKYL
jgi:hypothetical protein